VEVVPASHDDRGALQSLLERFGTITAGSPSSVAVRLAEPGSVDLMTIVRALDEGSLKVAQLMVHEPSLDDVFLEKTGRKLEGAGEADAPPAAVAEPAGASAP
jgi:ABC-2 type transport system ATP-binding protein